MNSPLDGDLVESESDIDSLASPMDRIRHFAVDLIIILLFYFSLVIVFVEYRETWGQYNVLILALFQFAYYSIFEYATGRTPGKFFNKTKVVSTDGSKPTFSQTLIRSLVRFIPFEFLPIFSLYNRCLHDMISRTWVVRIKKK